MTIEAEVAKDQAVSFEAWKEKIKEQDGGLYRIAFDVQAADLPQRVILAPKGTRFLVCLVELADDDTPKVKPKSYAQRAGALAALPEFWLFAFVDTLGQAVEKIRLHCGVRSRAEIDGNPEAMRKFDELFTGFQEWSKEKQRGRL